MISHTSNGRFIVSHASLPYNMQEIETWRARQYFVITMILALFKIKHSYTSRAICNVVSISITTFVGYHLVWIKIGMTRRHPYTATTRVRRQAVPKTILRAHSHAVSLLENRLWHSVPNIPFG